MDSKLVRDRIPEIMKSKGSTPVTHIASDEEYWQKLLEKLQEEVDEFMDDDSDEELADILEIIHAICDYKDMEWQDLEAVRKKKATERGSFHERVILDETR